MMSCLSSGLPRVDYRLSASVIHLWFFQVSRDPALLARLQELLGPEEVARANAFRFERLRQNYTFTHGFVRTLLGRYLDEDPAQLRLSTGPNGKPYIKQASGLQFNLSHCDEVGLIGLAADCDIGVDVEKIRSVEGLLDIASRFFCPEEISDLMSLPANEQQHGFFRCWTRKEAYLKAVGDGLRTDLDSFRVTIKPFEPARLIHINRSCDAAARWSLHNVESHRDWAAALAYSGYARDVRTQLFGFCRDFDCG